MGNTPTQKWERDVIRLLVVDNNAEFLEVFTRLVELQPEMEVLAQATSLAQARAKLEGVDVAIIDRGLPDGDGIEIISESGDHRRRACSQTRCA